METKWRETKVGRSHRSCAVGSQEGAEAEAGRSEQRAPADASPQRNPCWTAAVPVDDEQQDRGLRLCEDI